MALTRYEIHKRFIARKRAAAPPKPCDCGCGTIIPSINSMGKPARFAHGHNGGGENTRFRAGDNRLALLAVEARRQAGTLSGWKHSDEARAKMAGRKHSDEARAKMSAAQAAYAARLALSGEPHPSIGRRHTAETKMKMSAAQKGRNMGASNWGWKGGTGSLPYGPEFTKRFKRLIRDRDNHTCQRCGVTREQLERTLEVHHIDHDKMNNDPANLATVCSSCNVWCSWHHDEPFVAL